MFESPKHNEVCYVFRSSKVDLMGFLDARIKVSDRNFNKCFRGCSYSINSLYHGNVRIWLVWRDTLKVEVWSPYDTLLRMVKLTSFVLLFVGFLVGTGNNSCAMILVV